MASLVCTQPISASGAPTFHEAHSHSRDILGRDALTLVDTDHDTRVTHSVSACQA